MNNLVNVKVGGVQDVIRALQNYNTIILKPNIVDNRNVLTQEMMSEKHTKYIIKWNYILEGATINVPEDCILEFDGGSLSNGSITCNDTVIKSNTLFIGDDFSILGNYLGSLKASWLGIKDTNPNNGDILASIDSILVNKRHIELDSNITVDKPIIFPMALRIEGHGYNIINTATNCDYLFALSQLVELEELSLVSGDETFNGVILLWSTATYKDESPTMCYLKNIQINELWRPNHIPHSTGLYILCTADGQDKNHISGVNINNLRIQRVVDGVIIENNNTNGTYQSFAWSNNIHFDSLYVGASNNGVKILNIDPNHVGQAIGHYFIDYYMFQANYDGIYLPKAYYIDNQKLYVGNETAWDINNTTYYGELHNGSQLFCQVKSIAHYSYDLNQTDEQSNTYDYIEKIRCYDNSKVYYGYSDYNHRKQYFNKDSYDTSSGRGRVTLLSHENGIILKPDAEWENKGAITYQALVSKNNSYIQVYRANNNSKNSNIILNTPDGSHILHYDSSTNKYIILSSNVNKKDFTSAGGTATYKPMGNNYVRLSCVFTSLTATKDTVYDFTISIKQTKYNFGSIEDAWSNIGEVFKDISFVSSNGYFVISGKIKAKKDTKYLDLRVIFRQNEHFYLSANETLFDVDIDYTTDEILLTIAEAYKAPLLSLTRPNYPNNTNQGAYFLDASLTPARPIWWTGSYWEESDGTKVGAKRKGTTTDRPIGSLVYVGFMYFDTTLGKPVYASAISGDTVTWVDATGTTV